MINKALIIIALLSLCGFCYLPVWMNTTPVYNVSNTFYANANETTINSTSIIGVNQSCVESSGVHVLSVTNSSNIWSGSILINATGSWNCTATSYNTTDIEENSSVFTLTCPTSQPVPYLYACYSAISLTLDQNTTYFDVGDNVTLWALETNSTMTASMWLYSADNNTYPFRFSVIKNQWYVYYTVKQKQEILIIQTFTGSGVVTGIGEFTLTYNPGPPAQSFLANLYTQSGYLLLIVVVGILLIVVVMIAGPMVISILMGAVWGKE